MRKNIQHTYLYFMSRREKYENFVSFPGIHIAFREFVDMGAYSYSRGFIDEYRV